MSEENVEVVRAVYRSTSRAGFRSTATGIRTPVSAVRGRRPSPLDDSGVEARSRLANDPLSNRPATALRGLPEAPSPIPHSPARALWSDLASGCGGTVDTPSSGGGGGNPV